MIADHGKQGNRLKLQPSRMPADCRPPSTREQPCILVSVLVSIARDYVYCMA
jgi:hypothetical protein